MAHVNTCVNIDPGLRALFGPRLKAEIGPREHALWTAIDQHITRLQEEQRSVSIATDGQLRDAVPMNNNNSTLTAVHRDTQRQDESEHLCRPLGCLRMPTLEFQPTPRVAPADDAVVSTVYPERYEAWRTVEAFDARFGEGVK